MLRLVFRVVLLSSVSLLAACSQSPAPVEFKGQATYGRNPNSYALNYASPAYTTVVGNSAPSAVVQPIGVKDLAALSPAAGGKPPASTPFAASTPPPTIQLVSPAPMDTGASKPRFSDNAAVSAPAPQEKPVAKLDQMISGDNATSHYTKTAKTDTAFMWPVSGKKIISAFGPKGDGKSNDGINIAAAEGEPVWAAADGEVIYVGNELQGYGNMVLIKHANNKTTAYAHMSRANVDKYDRVKQGDIIGYVGATGSVKEPQLHFAIRDGKEPVDPMKYLNQNVASN